MKKKLVCVLVDDDPESHDIFIRLMRNSPFAELKHYFFNATDFLKNEQSLKYDICLLDIMLPDMSGFILAEKISKPYIFISGFKDRIFEAIEMAGPIDVVSKPTQSVRLNAALEKAYTRLIGIHTYTEQYYELFNVAGKRGKFSIVLSDIYYVKTDNKDRRNKNIILKSGEAFKLMDCTFDRLLKLSTNLCQTNKSEMISLEILDSIDSDMITIKRINGLKLPTWVTFSHIYKAHLEERLHLYNQK